MTTFNSAEDGRRNYALAIAAMREQCIRRGQIKPDAANPDEVRWAREGEVCPSQLDAVK